MRDRLEPHVIAEVLAASVDRDLFDGVAAAGRPVLVATGTEPGCLLDDETLDEWRRRVPGTEIAVIDGAAHDLFRPDRLAFPKIVHDFIVRRAPGT
jgi:pimeloyl-ACP methyl ester carboxylesterase